MSIELAMSAWRAVLGADNVKDADVAAERFGADTGGAQRAIRGLLVVHEAAQVQGVLRIASRHGVPVYPVSTGRNWGYGSALPATPDCVLIDLSRLRNIEFDADFGVVTVEPGVTQQDLADFLERGGHRYLVPVTGAGPTCSLLGNALERGFGITPHADHFGAVTSIEAYLADGTPYRSAMAEMGAATISRLFRYDLGPYSTGLFTQGAFGVVTRMSLVLAPRPQAVRVAVLPLRDEAALLACVGAIRHLIGSLGSVVGGVNLMNRLRTLAMSEDRYPAAGAGPGAVLPATTVEQLGRKHRLAPWTLVMTLYGTDAVVAAAEREIRRALHAAAAVDWLTLHAPPNYPRFMSRRFVAGARRVLGALPLVSSCALAQTKLPRLESLLHLAEGRPDEVALPLAYWRSPAARAQVPRNPATDGAGVLWYAPLVPMRAADVRTYVRMVERLAPDFGIEPMVTLTSLSERLFDSTVPIVFDRGDDSACRRARACLDALLREGLRLGFCPYRVGIDDFGWLAEQAPEAVALHGRLRASFDPANVVAPGRYGLGGTPPARGECRSI